jgi:CHAD domain-containing protein
VIERELKLALPGRFSIPVLTLEDEPLAAIGLPDLHLRATYYDTADLRLARHGVTLRFRTGDEGGPTWTLKLPVASSGTTLERNELDMPGPPREPPDQARTLVTAFARRERLVAVATLRTRRRRVRLLRDAEPVAELADDEVSVVEGRRIVSRFRELEIEALTDSLDLTPLADQLHRAGATDAEPIPKVVRALGSRATAPADITPAPVPADPTMADALVVAIASALARLVHNDPHARLGDEEAIHQVRVALRRLRSDLRTLGDAVDPAWRARIEPQLRSVAGALGEARDLDVLIGHLRKDASSAGMSLAPLFRALDARRARAHEQVRATLEADDYPGLLDALVDAIASPPVGPAAGAAAGEALPAVVASAWRRLEQRADDLEPDTADEQFHRARIAAKRARYATELAASVLPDKRTAAASELAAKLADLQDALGAVQDAAVAEGAIRENLHAPRVTATYAFDAGRLAERQLLRADQARDDFFDLWPKVRKRRWRKWLA